MSADDINFFFTLRDQIKLYHWQTNVFARHKATDEAIETLDKLIDQYVETYMGKYGRPRMNSKSGTVHVQNMTEKMAPRFINAAIGYLENQLVKKLKPSDTDLVNLRDEMLGELDQLLYLFSLK